MTLPTRSAGSLAVLLLTVLALPLQAAGWSGDQAELPVPATAEARQAEFSVQWLLKTPVEKLTPVSLNLPSAAGVVKFNLRLAVPGTGADKLWEYRWEPGKPWGPGTWVVFRDGLGRLREVRVVVLGGTTDADNRVASTGTWVRLSPVKDSRRTRLDLFLAGRLVTGGWEVPGQLAELVLSEDDWLWTASQDEIDWGSLLPLPRHEDERVDSLQKSMHKALAPVPVVAASLWLPTRTERTDGADTVGIPQGQWGLLPGQEGHAVRGLGAWGVTHWFTMGVLRGWNAAFPALTSLVEPRSRLPGYSAALVTHNLSADPAFAYDWIRNLGLSVFAARYPTRPLADNSADVSSVPFLESQELTGYSVDDAAPLLHLLAVTQPGRAYLASLSVQAAVKGVASSVTFLEPTILFPWVGADGDVRVVVFQGPRSISLAQWLKTGGSEKVGVRPDHVVLTELPLPTVVPLPLLPLR